MYEGKRLAARRLRNNVRLAASRKQIVPKWPPIACKNSMRLAARRIQIVPEWPPVPCKKSMQLEATLLQDLTQVSATLTGWRRTHRSEEGKMIALFSPGICSLSYRSFP
jgi:hypothetical protein